MEPASLVLQGCVGLFLFLEAANVAALYLSPGSTRFNAVGVFDGWEKSKSDVELHAFVRYLVFWVAGTKVILLGLWLVILLTAGPRTQLVASAVMVPAIATFYWRLHPIARDLDARGRMHPVGYSRTLAIMIAVFIGMFALATAVALA